MEDEKKKKKSKKKKNKQEKKNDDGPAGTKRISSVERNLESVNGENHDNKNGETLSLDEKSKATQEAKKDRSIDVLEEKIRVLETEKFSWLQKEKYLEEEVTTAQKDRQYWEMKVATVESSLAELESERNSFLLKEDKLKASIKNFESEKKAWLEKEINFEHSINVFASEKKAWVEMEDILKKQINHIKTELEACMMKEASVTVTIENLNCTNEGLLTRVKKLEESLVDGLKEKHNLMGKISHLEQRNQLLESEISVPAPSDVRKNVAKDEDSNSLIQSACALVEKLVVENSDLVEKVNELSIKLSNFSQATESTPVDELEHAAVISISEPSDTVSPALVIPETINSAAPTSTLENIRTFGHRENTVNPGNEHAKTLGLEEIRLESSEEGIGNEEIIPVPLEDDEIQQLEAGVAKGDEDGVRLTDAPLIGAPFRLISFVAKYVSGADLVDRTH